MRLLLLFVCLYMSTALSSNVHIPKLPFKVPLKLPPPMRSNVKGSWAYDTMSRRVITDILKRLVDDNADELTRPTSPLRSECLLQINDLKSSLECGKTGYMRGLSDKGPDVATWDKILATLSDDERNWLDAPWVISEFYLYRRIAEAFKFFETGYDMFVQQKAQGLIDAIPAINEISTKLPVILSSANLADALTIAIQTSLWGNKMDLSLWPAGLRKSEGGSATVDTPGAISFGSTLTAGKKFILDDYTSAVVSLLVGLHAEGSSSKREIGIIVDNAGYELFSDMLLGHCLLELGAATSIRFFTKGHPTFVSDATNDDFMETVGFLASSQSSPTADLASQFSAHLDGGRFVLDSDLFWCQPTAMWDMPDLIQQKVEECKLVFVKGDANYRRLLGELEWDIETPASDILSYWPVPVCALRTFKAEIGCGISREKVAEVEASDPTWMVGGRWGVVQLGGKNI